MVLCVRAFVLVLVLFVTITSLFTHSMPDSFWFREPTLSESELTDRASAIDHWAKSSSLGLSRGRQTGFFVCVVFSLSDSVSAAAAQLMHSFFSGLSDEERGWMYVVGVVSGEQERIQRSAVAELLDQFHDVFRDKGAAAGLARGLSECRKHARLVLWLDGGLNDVSSGIVRKLVAVEREALKPTIPHAKLWLAVNLFRGGLPSWTFQTLSPFLFRSAVVMSVLCCMSWWVMRECIGLRGTLRVCLELAVLAILLWVSLCLLLGRQNVSPTFREGTNPYVGGMTHAMLINGRNPLVDQLEIRLKDAKDATNLGGIIDEVSRKCFRIKLESLTMSGNSGRNLPRCRATSHFYDGRAFFSTLG
jgi:hypothetical protein